MPASDTRVTVVRAESGAAIERLHQCAAAAVLSGPPASGKTSTLAAYAADLLAAGKRPLVVASHPSGCAAFAQALASRERRMPSGRLATLPEHAAAWMRSEYLGAAAAPLLWVGGAGATRAVLDVAARGLLDLTWPLLRKSDVNFDVPYLSKPDSFLDEAASLLRLLQRSRVTAEEFEEGCARGLGAFYGEQTERALVLLADKELQRLASRRGKDAMRASAASLGTQRKAERDVAAILAQLYREYQRAAAAAAFRSPEDLLAACLHWLSGDTRAAARIAQSIDALLIDDAEDAVPALVPLVEVLRRQRAFVVVVAGWEASHIDGFGGKRSALPAFADAERLELPRTAQLPVQVQRFADEAAEVAWLAQAASELIARGCPPGEIAVLTRNTGAAGVYARSLESAGVPAVMPSCVWQRPHQVADLLALGAVVDDPFDEERLLRVLSSPVTALSDASVYALCREPVGSEDTLFEVAGKAAQETSSPPQGTLARNVLDGLVDETLAAPAQQSLVSLREQLARWRSACTARSLSWRLRFLAAAAGFVEHWHAAPDFERPRLLDDLERLAEATACLESAGCTGFARLENRIAASVLDMRPAKHDPGAVVVETITAVKGLRFEHVFVSGVAHERFPQIYTSHAMAFSRTYGLIVRENVARGAAQTAKFAWYYARFAAKAMYLEEERRALAYGLSRGGTSATATGFGAPPRWAKDHDLLAELRPSNGEGSQS